MLLQVVGTNQPREAAADAPRFPTLPRDALWFPGKG